MEAKEEKDQGKGESHHLKERTGANWQGKCDGYYVAYKPITLPCILFMFIEMKFIHFHSYVIFSMKSINIYTDLVNYDEIII